MREKDHNKRGEERRGDPYLVFGIIESFPYSLFSVFICFFFIYFFFFVLVNLPRREKERIRGLFVAIFRVNQIKDIINFITFLKEIDTLRRKTFVIC